MGPARSIARLMSVMAVIWAVVSSNSEASSNSRCNIPYDEKAGSTDLAAGAVDGGGDVEEIGVAEKRKPGIEKRDAFGERRANQQHGGGFLRAFGGKAGSGVLGFAKDVGNFVFAADVGEAFDFASAGGRQENLAAGFELGLHVRHAGDNVAVKARAGTRGGLKLRGGTDAKGKLLAMNLRSCFERAIEFRFAPQILGSAGRGGE